jgi:hypothetical protein
VQQRPTSINYDYPIDGLFVRGAAHRNGHVETVADISDHYPIVATIDR